MKRAPSATATPKANGATIEAILTCLEAIEAEIQALASNIAVHTARQSALLGWRQIGRYLGKSGRTAMRYKQLAGLPGIRVGRGILSSPALLDAWLLSYDRERRHRQGRKV